MSIVDYHQLHFIQTGQIKDDVLAAPLKALGAIVVAEISGRKVNRTVRLAVISDFNGRFSFVVISHNLFDSDQRYCLSVVSHRATESFCQGAIQG
ncbi:MAG: hypothetical protein SOI66_07430 [Bifidobacterium sp.]